MSDVRGELTGTEDEKQPDEELRQAQLQRLAADRKKVELEAREIDRRINAKWWESQQLTQYGLALVIATALLFGWFKLYVEEGINKKLELTELKEKINASKNDELKREALVLKKREAEARDTAYLLTLLIGAAIAAPAISTANSPGSRRAM